MSSRAIRSLIGILLLSQVPASAQTIEPALVASIEAEIAREMATQELVGLSVAVGLGDQVSWTAGFGHSDLENAVPAAAHTVYRLASISKPVTAAAVMQLVEQGKIDLDLPVETYVSAWKKKRHPVTTRLLLAHMGGIRHYRRGELQRGTRAYLDATSALELFADDALISEPGTSYSYSTYGYNLLGAVVEGASGMSFVAYLNEKVFPAARTESMQDDSQSRIIKHRAQGYRRLGGAISNSALVDTSYKVPGGGLCATASDLVRFAIAMHDGKLVTPATRDLMWTRQKTNSGHEIGYGLGWGVGSKFGRRFVAHSGAQSRVRTNLIHFPDDGLTIALLCNCEWADAGRLTDGIARLLLQKK